MVTKPATVRNANGIHVRPSGVIAKEMKAYEAESWIEVGDNRVGAKNVLALLSLGLVCGQTVAVGADGADEGEACLKLHELIETHFDFPPRPE